MDSKGYLGLEGQQIIVGIIVEQFQCGLDQANKKAMKVIPLQFESFTDDLTKESNDLHGLISFVRSSVKLSNCKGVEKPLERLLNWACGVIKDL